MNRRLIFAALLLLGGCAGSGDETGSADQMALVALGRVEKRTITESVTLYGAIESGPGGRHSLYAATDAIVTRIDAPSGSAVRRGQVVARLTASSTSRLELAKAAADAQAATQAYARAQRMRADGLIGDAELEIARATASDAEATRSSLAGRSAALMLRAPTDGYVESITSRPGELVAAGSVVATIARLDDLRAHFGIDPVLARRLRPGENLRITPPGGNQPFDVPIQSINPVVDPKTRLASVFGRVPAGIRIGIGEAVAANVAISADKDTLAIPYAALLDDAGQSYVFVVSSNVAHRRNVATGATSEDRVAILNGLQPGDEVVTQGGTALVDGMKVRTQ